MTQRPRRLSILTPSARQAPFLEYSEREGRWRVWQSFDPSATKGTYLDLYSDGGVDRVTIGPDGSIKGITTIVTRQS